MGNDHSPKIVEYSIVNSGSIPAFAALKTGGGLTWLQYEPAVPPDDHYRDGLFDSLSTQSNISDFRIPNSPFN